MKRFGMIAAAAVLMSCSSIFATENGGNGYPNGAEGYMAGALPPPGMYSINYVLYYTADNMMDGSGNKLPIDFDLDVFAYGMRFINVTDKKLFGANWAQHIFVPVMSVDVTTPGGSDDTIGLGDIIVDPLIFGWHTPHFHWVAGLEVYVPVGKYDENDIANVGRNYWTLEPAAAATYLSDGGYELSIKAMYDINMENNATDYDSGDEFHFDYALAKHMSNWTLGISGFYYSQITGDDGTIMTPGGPVDAGDNKGFQIGLGPMLAYQYKGMAFVLKYLDDIETENKPDGGRFWLKFIMPL